MNAACIPMCMQSLAGLHFTYPVDRSRAIAKEAELAGSHITDMPAVELSRQSGAQSTGGNASHAAAGDETLRLVPIYAGAAWSEDLESNR